jgi:uncharacterized damage-inducible protein DinB
MIGVIKGTLENIAQLSSFIQSVPELMYRELPYEIHNSSIGQHVRHICDIYQALMRDFSSDEIDYNVRRRGHVIEENKLVALTELKKIHDWVESIASDDLCHGVAITVEASFSQQCVSTMNSNKERELFYAFDHTTHHLAMAALIAKHLKCPIDANLGVSPSTATYLRSKVSDLTTGKA